MIFFGGLALASITLAAAADAEYLGWGPGTHSAVSTRLASIGHSVGDQARGLLGVAGKGAPVALPESAAGESSAHGAAVSTTSMATGNRQVDAADGAPTDIPGPGVTLLFAIATIALLRRFC